MKKTDDTPVPENESVIVDLLVLETWISLWVAELRLIERLEDCEKRIANLETQRTPQDENDDPEWH